MKKYFKLTCAAALIFALLLSFASVFAAANVIKIDGIAAEIPDGMGQIREKDDRTFVPLRFVSEFLGNDVWYMDYLKMAGINSNDAVMYVQDGNNILYKVSKTTSETLEIPMDTSAYIDATEGRMYLPIRFLAEALNYTVGWDEETQTVTLDMNE